MNTRVLTKEWKIHMNPEFRRGIAEVRLDSQRATMSRPSSKKKYFLINEIGMDTTNVSERKAYEIKCFLCFFLSS